MRLALLTDPHVVPDGRRLYALDPAARLRAAMAAIARTHRDLDLLVITGDLVHDPDAAAYRVLRDCLEGAPAPLLLLLGNHDHRGFFKETFPKAACDADGFVQSVHTLPQATVVALDTLDETRVDGSGALCARRLDFLARALGEAPVDRPLLLFLHHPPMPIGIPGLDAIRLADPAALEAVIARTRRPDHMFCGHVHRPISGVWAGIPFHTGLGVSHQLAFDHTSEIDAPGTHEPPHYALVTVEGSTVVVHTCAFLYDGPVFSLMDPVAAAATRL